MPEISRFFGIVIRMFYDDHARPQFHALYGSSEAQFDISTGSILSGSLPPRERRRVLRWLKLHRTELAADWQLARRRIPPQKIDPLE